MAKALNVFYSNRLEILYQQLKSSLFNLSNKPLMRRIVVVYGPAMKTWLMLRMAQDSEINVAMGIEFIYLKQAFDTLLKLSTNANNLHLPSLLDLSLAIETEIFSILQIYPTLKMEEQLDWEPVLRYLKLSPLLVTPHENLSFKIEKRLISLSQHLARLFHDYGRYALQMVNQWEDPSFRGWQPCLWRRLFGKNSIWCYPSRALSQEVFSSEIYTLHFFSISFITASEFDFLNRLAEYVAIDYYLISPCAVFWSDIRSDHENIYLQNYWKNKKGTDSSQILNLEELLSDRNPLLANFGRLGREMTCQIENSCSQTSAAYVLPESVKEIQGEILNQPDLYLIETPKSLTLLLAVQADLLMLRNPQAFQPFNFEQAQQSIQLHVASCKRREVQILYHNVLALMANDSTLCPSDVIVMAPQIEEYVPYIHSLFGNDQSQLDFQILDLGLQTHHEIVQAFLQLLKFSESRWDAVQLLQLFEYSSFQRCHQITSDDLSTIREWVKHAGIRWGEDIFHRNELLKQRHCQQEMNAEAAIGTWDYGLLRLQHGLVSVADSNSSAQSKISPCPGVDFSQSELLCKWIRLLHSLRDDLSPLQDKTHMTMENWVNYLNCLLDNYFQPDFQNPQSISEFGDLREQFEILRHASRFIKEAKFRFASIKTHLFSLLEQRETTYREDHLQAIRFCSLMPLRSIPAKVIALMGMQEGSFPRMSFPSSLNLMQEKENANYCPSPIDFDRYLFLEALHSAQEHLLLSYQGFNQQDSKEVRPSLVIEELFSYLDKYYTIQGEKISQKCIFNHPFDAFDKSYFYESSFLRNYSQQDYFSAKIQHHALKSPPHLFSHDFHRSAPIQMGSIENHSELDLKHLTSLARDPIKFHFNKVLEIYLQKSEDRKLKTEEEFVVSKLDGYRLQHAFLKNSIDDVLSLSEKEGKLPFGLFKETAVNKLKEDYQVIEKCLDKHSLNASMIFQFEFSKECSSPYQLKDNHWILPAINLMWSENCYVSIVGKISYATPKGLLVLSKGSFSDVWKTWPQFLLYCYAAKQFPNFEQQLILAQAIQPKKVFFVDPEPYLKQWIHYYALCLQNFSPLLPDWIQLILDNETGALQDKLKNLYAESFSGYQNPYLHWIFNKHHLPNSETMIKFWKEEAELLAGDLVKFWFPTRRQKKE